MLGSAVAAAVISAHLDELAPVQRPRFIAVDGLTGAGKTTFGEHLAGALGGVVVHTDDLAQAGPQLWDHARFTRDVWEPLSRGLPAHAELQHWTADGPTGTLDLPADSRIVVVEGIRALDRAVGVDWDVRVWVKVPEDIRLVRAQARDGGRRWDCWSTTWLPQELEYVRVQQPEETADFIVDGTR
jgi:uridine kinase